MGISRDEVLRVAELANLELAPEELATYAQQLDSILNYIEKLNKLDTTRVEPMAQVLSEVAGAEIAVLRDDTPVADDVADKVLAVAPDPCKPFFRVPKVIER